MKKNIGPPKIDWVEGVVDLALSVIAVGLGLIAGAFLDRRQPPTPMKRL